ncbi:MAG: hypothetical protein H6536_01295 [Bacteroidales bacterium]|nr:hypothetical protein [Bacteroidales bacterium]
MTRIKNIITGLTLAALAMITVPSCVDFTYDDIEPRTDSTSLSANTTIAELKAQYPGSLHKLNGADSIIIEGTIISNDKAGNFYKSLFIEDGTAAIELKLNKTTLYNDYKLGQKIVVYCNELYLGDYGGQIQLGSMYYNSGVPTISSLEGDVIINKHVFKKGKAINEVAPIEMTPLLLKTSNIGRLVQFNNVQIRDTLSLITGTTFTYADKVNQLTINHALTSQTQNYVDLVLRTSGYAQFAGETINTKQGTIVGVLTYYNGTYQLIIRDLNDVKFDQERFQI